MISRRTKLLIVIGVLGLVISLIWWRAWYKSTYATRGAKLSVTDSTIEWTPEVDLHPPTVWKVLLLGSVAAIIATPVSAVRDIKRRTILKQAKDGAKD